MTIEQLQKIVNDESRPTKERRQAAEHILALEGQQTEVDELARQIRDDDPELEHYWARLPDTDPWGFLPRSIEQGKKALAAHRRSQRLKARAGDEFLPMPERLEAAKQWLSGLQLDRSYWSQFSGADLVERLMPHPHAQRLSELTRMFRDEQATVKGRLAALDEYRRLRDEFPKREEPKHGLLGLDWGYRDVLGWNLAHQVGQAVAAKTGASAAYIAKIVHGNRGADYDIKLSDIASEESIAEPTQHEVPRPKLTPEAINDYFDMKIAELR